MAITTALLLADQPSGGEIHFFSLKRSTKHYCMCVYTSTCIHTGAHIYIEREDIFLKQNKDVKAQLTAPKSLTRGFKS